ncbi:MAG: tRNA lysidine(34) synthetase TilS, partial [Proteobacteria bacterium]|nr:tRNA lysidine(34) synthetase TilS [Pseudomonadota bacterium]
SLDKQKEISWEKEWDLKEPLVLPGNLGLLKAEQTLGRGITLPEEERVTVRFRRGGEYCHPVGRQGSHPLKKCFQEWNIPQWERSQVPLIYYNDELVAVVGYCICEPYQADPNQNGIEFKRLF